LSSIVQKYARGNYDTTIYLLDNIPPSTPAKSPYQKITGVSAEASRGILSGRKALTVEGVLTQNGTIVGSFTDYRTMSGGPMTTGYRGVCYLLNLSVKRIGKDVGIWLGEPTMNALLGKEKRRRKSTEAGTESHVESEDKVVDEN
jgi:hypothetical protein